jgi:hypothetical protein
MEAADGVGIVNFRADPPVQKSVVRDNLVLSAGNPAFAAIGIDGLRPLRTQESTI